jgi:glycosyltransferase involved in cell wall biosynthesis
MNKSLRVLMLLTDGFGGIGGIAKFNRDFLQALDSCALVERIYAQPRLIPEPIGEMLPEAVVYDRTAARGKMAFMRRLGVRAWSGGRVDLVICAHLYLLPVAWVVARLFRARLALIVYGLEAWSPSSKLLANRLARAVDAFISITRYSAERFANWSRIPLDRAFILPPCVDLGQFQPEPRDLKLVARYGLQESKVIMTMGRVAAQERYKGFDEVIDLVPDLLARVPSLKYLIVGDGSDRPRLEAKVGALGLKQSVVFAGYIPESEKVALYSLADVYVMPSSGEGFGIVLIEAAACGVPVIGSQIDGSREALLEGRLGRLVDPRNPQELLEEITVALEIKRGQGHIKALDTYNPENFKTRVAKWCRAQLGLQPVDALSRMDHAVPEAALDRHRSFVP